jgi:uncharacterized protein DUF6152
MKDKTVTPLFLVVGILMICRPMFAHHGSSAYDQTKTVTLKITVTRFEWANPHTQVYFDATDIKGTVVHWVAETTNPAMLARVGWSTNTLKTGDQITIIANPNKVGAPVIFLQKVVLANGQELETKKGF